MARFPPAILGARHSGNANGDIARNSQFPEHGFQFSAEGRFLAGEDLYSLVRLMGFGGPIPKSQLASRFNTFDFGKDMAPEDVKAMMESSHLKEWTAKENMQDETLGLKKNLPWYSRPGLYEMTTVEVMIALMIWL